MTEKIYYKDIYKSEFDAVIKSCELNDDGSANIILDKTLFYPGGGGQPCDTGSISFISDNNISDFENDFNKFNKLEVINAFERDDEIVHVVKINGNEFNEFNDNNKNKINTGEKIHGVINWERRFELMQQHLGQHMLAAALFKNFELNTARMRIEGDNVSLDIDNIHVDENIIKEAESIANEAIYKDIKVEILYPDFDEIKLNSRKLPKQTNEPIRIVKIGDFDYVPCCGLHVRSSGEVGIIKVTSIENHKGGTRVNLRCGRAAFRYINIICRDMRRLQVEMTCGEDNLFERVLNLREQVKNLKARNDELKVHEIAAIAAELLNKAKKIGEYLVIAHVMSDVEVEEVEQEDVKKLFKILTERRGVIALLAGIKAEKAENEKNNFARAFLTFGCNKDDKDIDVRNAFKAAISAIDGKGGGSKFCAQGQALLKHDDMKINIKILQDALDTALNVLRQDNLIKI